MRLFVSGCTNPGSSYLTYEGARLRNHNIAQMENVTSALECQAVCSTNSTCFSIDYWPANQGCHLNGPVTALDYPHHWEDGFGPNVISQASHHHPWSEGTRTPSCCQFQSPDRVPYRRPSALQSVDAYFSVIILK